MLRHDPTCHDCDEEAGWEAVHEAQMVGYVPLPYYFDSNNIGSKVQEDPIDFFDSLFVDEMWDNLVEVTNLYDDRKLHDDGTINNNN